MVQDRGLLKEVGTRIINAGGLEIRDVDDGEDPFLYSSLNRGPGYIMIKGLVGQPHVLGSLTRELALKLADNINFDFIAGNATGGMVPGWQLRNELDLITGQEVPYVYVRETRKVGGHGEQICGDRNNPLIQSGMRALVFEELVNFAQTTCNSAEVLRNAGYVADNAATILSYGNPKALELLAETGVTLTPLITLPQLLDVAESTGRYEPRVVQSFRDFLQDPVHWQTSRGYELPTP